MKDKAQVCQRIVAGRPWWGFIGGDEFMPFDDRETASVGAALYDAGVWTTAGLALSLCPPVAEVNAATTAGKEAQ